MNERTYGKHLKQCLPQSFGVWIAWISSAILIHIKSSYSFLAGTMEGTEKKKKKIPAWPETLKKTWKNFQSLKTSAWERSLPRRCLGRQEGSLSMKNLCTVLRNISRCTELRFEWLGWQEKVATAGYLQNPKWHLSSGSKVSVVWAQNVAASLPPSVHRWHLHETHWGSS